jgi:hypothetical protein
MIPDEPQSKHQSVPVKAFSGKKIITSWQACPRLVRGTDRPKLLSFFSHFLFEILAVQNIPLSAARGDMTGKRENFMANDIIDVAFPLKKVMQHAFGFRQGAPLMGKIGKIFLPKAVYDQMGQVRDAAFR